MVFFGPGRRAVVEETELLKLNLLTIRHLSEDNRRRMMQAVPVGGSLKGDYPSLGVLLLTQSLLWFHRHLRTLSYLNIQPDRHMLFLKMYRCRASPSSTRNVLQLLGRRLVGNRHCRLGKLCYLSLRWMASSVGRCFKTVLLVDHEGCLVLLSHVDVRLGPLYTNALMLDNLFTA